MMHCLRLSTLSTLLTIVTLLPHRLVTYDGISNTYVVAFTISETRNDRVLQIEHFRPLNSIVRTKHPEKFDMDRTTKSTLSSPLSLATILHGKDQHTRTLLLPIFMFVIMSSLLLLVPSFAAYAVSGGGLDYAGIDISNQNFSNGNYKGKDFTQVIAKATNFAGSNLQGCRFYKAYLVKADFRNTDLRGASLEDTSMDDAILENAVATGAYFSKSINDASNLQNVDFTDAQIPSKTLLLLCDRDDIQHGTNPITGVNTKESLMCP